MFCQTKRKNEKGNQGISSHTSKGCTKDNAHIKHADTSTFSDASFHSVFLNSEAYAISHHSLAFAAIESVPFFPQSPVSSEPSFFRETCIT